MRTYPDRTVVEVEADEAGGEGGVLLDPLLDLAVDDSFGVGACPVVVGGGEAAVIVQVWQDMIKIFGVELSVLVRSCRKHGDQENIEEQDGAGTIHS